MPMLILTLTPIRDTITITRMLLAVTILSGW